MVGLLAVTFAIHRLEDFDTWYHLAAGRLMVARGPGRRPTRSRSPRPSIPGSICTGSFSCCSTARGRSAASTACMLLAAALVATTASCSTARARLGAAGSWRRFCLAVALTVSCPRFVPRPELMSFLYFAIYLVLLEGYPRNGRAIFARAVADPLGEHPRHLRGRHRADRMLLGSARRSRFCRCRAGGERRRGLTFADWRRLTVVLVLADARLLLESLGGRRRALPVQLLPRVTGNSLFSSRIGEFRAPLQLRVRAAARVHVGRAPRGLGASFLAECRGAGISDACSRSLAFGLLSTQSLRNMAFFGWIAVACDRRQPRPVARRGAGCRRASRDGLAIAALAGIVLLSAAVVDQPLLACDGRSSASSGSACRARAFRRTAIAFIERAGITGRAFNCLAMGGYLTWIAPARRRLRRRSPRGVSRGRYSAATSRRWTSRRRGRRLVGPYTLDYALLYHGWSNRLPLVNYLAQGSRLGRWSTTTRSRRSSCPADERASRDARARDSRAFADVRRERQQRSDPAPPSALVRALAVPVAETWRQRVVRQDPAQLRLPDEAARRIERSLALDPEQIDARFALGFAYWNVAST